MSYFSQNIWLALSGYSVVNEFKFFLNPKNLSMNIMQILQNQTQIEENRHMLKYFHEFFLRKSLCIENEIDLNLHQNKIIHKQKSKLKGKSK